MVNDWPGDLASHLGLTSLRMRADGGWGTTDSEQQCSYGLFQLNPPFSSGAVGSTSGSSYLCFVKPTDIPRDVGQCQPLYSAPCCLCHDSKGEASEWAQGLCVNFRSTPSSSALQYRSLIGGDFVGSSTRHFLWRYTELSKPCTIFWAMACPFPLPYEPCTPFCHCHFPSLSFCLHLFLLPHLPSV